MILIYYLYTIIYYLKIPAQQGNISRIINLDAQKYDFISYSVLFQMNYFDTLNERFIWNQAIMKI